MLKLCLCSTYIAKSHNVLIDVFDYEIMCSLVVLSMNALLKD